MIKWEMKDGKILVVVVVWAWKEVAAVHILCARPIFLLFNHFSDLFSAAGMSPFGSSGSGSGLGSGLGSGFASDRTFFGTSSSSSSSSSSFSSPPRPKQVEVALTLEEMFLGTTKTVHSSHREKCLECNGQGGTKSMCPECEGVGMKRHRKDISSDIIEIVQVSCHSCSGTGRIVTFACRECQGNRFLNISKDHILSVPRGVFKGLRLAVPPSSPMPSPLGDEDDMDHRA